MMVDMAAMEREVTINNDYGLHFRPAMQLVDVASQYRAQIKLVKDQQIVDGKSIMEVMMLAAAKGTTLVIRAEGDDAEDAVLALERLVRDNWFTPPQVPEGRLPCHLDGPLTLDHEDHRRALGKARPTRPSHALRARLSSTSS